MSRYSDLQKEIDDLQDQIAKITNHLWPSEEKEVQEESALTNEIAEAQDVAAYDDSFFRSLLEPSSAATEPEADFAKSTYPIFTEDDEVEFLLDVSNETSLADSLAVDLAKMQELRKDEEPELNAPTPKTAKIIDEEEDFSLDFGDEPASLSLADDIAKMQELRKDQGSDEDLTAESRIENEQLPELEPYAPPQHIDISEELIKASEGSGETGVEREITTDVLRQDEQALETEDQFYESRTEESNLETAAQASDNPLLEILSKILEHIEDMHDLIRGGESSGRGEWGVPGKSDLSIDLMTGGESENNPASPSIDPDDLEHPARPAYRDFRRSWGSTQ